MPSEWFFAHEAAHLYQGQAASIEARNDAWVHEGAAEFFAGQASVQGVLQGKLENAKEQCVAGLTKEPNYIRASKRDFKLHYSCGLILMTAINTELTKANRGADLFTLWQRFNQRVVEGQTASASTFIAVLSPYLPEEMNDFLRHFSSHEEFSSVAFFSGSQ